MSGPHDHGHDRDEGPWHDHQWHLPDGTGLHAPIGQLLRDTDTGDLCCHVCGNYYRALGAHVRVHGYTADEYRRVMGLARTGALLATTLSAAIADRQRTSYHSSTDHRANLTAGHAMARNGELTELARRSTTHPRPQTSSLHRDELSRGRITQAEQRSTRLQQRLTANGIDDLDRYLRAAYRNGTSVDQLVTITGASRARVRNVLRDSDIHIRNPGANTPAGKRSRAVAADAQAAALLGIEDLPAWLTERHEQGVSLTKLARTVGHSSHWVRWRINHPVAPDTTTTATATARHKLAHH